MDFNFIFILIHFNPSIYFNDGASSKPKYLCPKKKKKKKKTVVHIVPISREMRWLYFFIYQQFFYFFFILLISKQFSNKQQQLEINMNKYQFVMLHFFHFFMLFCELSFFSLDVIFLFFFFSSINQNRQQVFYTPSIHIPTEYPDFF